MDRVRIIKGEHAEKIGIVTGMMWGANICVVILEDGTEHGFEFNEIEVIHE